MADHTFGSDWTAKKLSCVREYAAQWAAIMEYEKKKWGWKTHYIDAFSGTGTYAPKKSSKIDTVGNLFELESDTEKDTIRAGSAQIAIQQIPKFDRIDLIEKDTRKAQKLRDIAGAELNKRVFVHEADVNDILKDLCSKLNKSDRAILFLDPFGCQVWWETLKYVASTEVVDLWYLFSIMGVNRKLPQTPENIPSHEREILNKCLGTTEWESYFYSNTVEMNLFGEIPKTTRVAGPSKVEVFFQDKLGEIFPVVAPDCLRLTNSNNGHMFSLYFAISNRSEAAKKLALKLVTPILKRWEENA